MPHRLSYSAWLLLHCDVGSPKCSQTLLPSVLHAANSRRDARYAASPSDAEDDVRAMELPRIASQSSICPPIQLLTQCPNRPRTPVSKRLLNCSNQNSEPQIPVLPCAPNYQPSRRKEEAKVLQNLRRRLNAAKIVQANRPEPVEARSCANNNLSPEETDNRPFLLQKILHNRPVSMVLDISEIRTAWQDSDFITDCLCWHNVYRQRHNSPPLVMSPDLCHLAQTWANHLAHTNRFYYRNDKDIGQNLFCRTTNGIVTDVSGQEVTSYWYSAVKQYDFSNEPDRLRANVNAGHFTQLVWASSRHLGVGKARSRSGKVVVVAHYAPAGNLSGAYLENVFPPCEELPRSDEADNTANFLSAFFYWFQNDIPKDEPDFYFDALPQPAGALANRFMYSYIPDQLSVPQPLPAKFVMSGSTASDTDSQTTASST